MKNILSLLVFVMAGVLLAGCRTESEGAKPPLNTTSFDLENKANFVLLDSMVQRSVTCSGIQKRTTPEGRLEVTAHVRNREARRIQVQINCVFKDEQGFTTGDETPFQNLILSENAQEDVKFVSMNDKARDFTIRVRQAH
ncbi:MAG: YcfL family protein [Verrucomicrobiota bacterium]